MNSRQEFYPLEPYVNACDYSILRQVTWHDIDRKASELLGRDCLGIPSVRVGICWTLEYLGYSRHHDHVLLPKYIGRCILNSLNRYAFPVENLTNKTRLVIVVNQYGFSQQLDKITAECSSRGLQWIENSPYGLSLKEELAQGSLAKFIGLSKILPVLKGALVLARDPSLVAFIERKREEFSLWSVGVLCAMAFLRHHHRQGGYSALADAAYEMYIPAKGDNNWARGNILRALGQFHSFADQTRYRLALVKEKLENYVIEPDTRFLSYVVPFFPKQNQNKAQEIFMENGFSPGIYHVDLAYNLFSPTFEKALLIPLNPRIPIVDFKSLLNDLAGLIAS